MCKSASNYPRVGETLAINGAEVIACVAYAEGLRWRDGALWWSDIRAGTVHRLVPRNAPETIARDITSASGLGWTSNGKFLVASILDSTIYELKSSGLAAPFSAFDQHNCLSTNDMTVMGTRVYVSYAGKTFEPGDENNRAAGWGGILLIDGNTGIGRPTATGLNMPNGMAITPDGKTMFVAETFGHRISSFPILPDGSLGERSLFSETIGSPDGMSLDADLGLWVGMSNSNEFSRLDRSGGISDRIIGLGEDWWTIACVLGGEDGRTLFMAVARREPAGIFEGHGEGFILAKRVTVPAAACPIDPQ